MRSRERDREKSEHIAGRMCRDSSLFLSVAFSLSSAAFFWTTVPAARCTLICRTRAAPSFPFWLHHYCVRWSRFQTVRQGVRIRPAGRLSRADGWGKRANLILFFPSCIFYQLTFSRLVLMPRADAWVVLCFTVSCYIIMWLRFSIWSQLATHDHRRAFLGTWN